MLAPVLFHVGTRASCAAGRWRVLGYIRHGSRLSARMCSSATRVQHSFTAVVVVIGDILESMVYLPRAKEKGGKRTRQKIVVKEEPQTSCRLLYADDAGFVSQLPGSLQRIMMAIVTRGRCSGSQPRRLSWRLCDRRLKAQGKCRSIILQLARYTDKQTNLCFQAGSSAETTTQGTALCGVCKGSSHATRGIEPPERSIQLEMWMLLSAHSRT